LSIEPHERVEGTATGKLAVGFFVLWGLSPIFGIPHPERFAWFGVLATLVSAMVKDLKS
jgi:hypothetical protein